MNPISSAVARVFGFCRKQGKDVSWTVNLFFLLRRWKSNAFILTCWNSLVWYRVSLLLVFDYPVWFINTCKVFASLAFGNFYLFLLIRMEGSIQWQRGKAPSSGIRTLNAWVVCCWCKCKFGHNGLKLNLVSDASLKFMNQFKDTGIFA